MARDSGGHTTWRRGTLDKKGYYELHKLSLNTLRHKRPTGFIDCTRQENDQNKLCIRRDRKNP
jgi:hypothetical protein